MICSEITKDKHYVTWRLSYMGIKGKLDPRQCLSRLLAVPYQDLLI